MPQRFIVFSARLACLMAAGLFCASCGTQHETGLVFPDRHWACRTPEQGGFDADRLGAATERIDGAGCIVHKGYLIHAWGRYAHRLDASSAAKAVYSHLLFMSVADGRLDSLDAPVHRHAPGLTNLNAALEYKDRAITWRHLATQTSGYGVTEPPGTAFNYSDYQMALLIDTLVFNVFDTGYHRADDLLLAPFFSDPLGCEDAPTLNSPHSHPGRLRISARDFARFGLLYLAGGTWDGRPVLPRRFVDLARSAPLSATTPRTAGRRAETLPQQRSIGAGDNQEEHLNSYSYAWWVNGIDRDGNRVLPDAPPDTCLAVGHAKRDVLLVIPSLDLVVCWLDAFHNSIAAHYSKKGHIHINAAIRDLLAARLHQDAPKDSSSRSN